MAVPFLLAEHVIAIEIDQVGAGLDHPPGGAGRADVPALA